MLYEIVKYSGFFLASVLGVPIGLYLLMYQRRWFPLFILALTLFTAFDVDINLWGHELYRGQSRGFEVAANDIIILAMALYTFISPKRLQAQKIPAGSFLYLLFFLFSLLSCLNSDSLLYSGYELFRYLRMYCYFYFLYQFLTTSEHVLWVLRGFSFVVFVNLGLMLKQHYLDHMYQAKGLFSHQNSAVMYVNLLNGIFFAYLLNAQDKKTSRLVWMSLTCLAGFLSTLLTLSRGGMMAMALGLGFIILASVWPLRRLSLKKITLFTGLLLASVLILLKVGDSVVHRYRTAPPESAQYRVELAIAALKMVHDQPLGIGPNNFALKANDSRYHYTDHIFLYEGMTNGLVETVYLLTAAESGWHTLVVYLLFLGLFLYKALKLFWRSREPFISALALGIAGGLMAIYFESCFEWVLRQTSNYYQMMLIFALVLVLERLDAQQAALGERQ